MMALRPRRAARLKTFEPTTTPTPRSPWLATSAVTAVEISGASAPSAVRMPCRPSEAPSRSLTRSSARAKTRLAPRLAATHSTKTGIAAPTDTRHSTLLAEDERPDPHRLPQDRVELAPAHAVRGSCDWLRLARPRDEGPPR